MSSKDGGGSVYYSSAARISLLKDVGRRYGETPQRDGALLHIYRTREKSMLAPTVLVEGIY